MYFRRTWFINFNWWLWLENFFQKKKKLTSLEFCSTYAWNSSLEKISSIKSNRLNKQHHIRSSRATYFKNLSNIFLSFNFQQPRNNCQDFSRELFNSEDQTNVYRDEPVLGSCQKLTKNPLLKIELHWIAFPGIWK